MISLHSNSFVKLILIGETVLIATPGETVYINRMDLETQIWRKGGRKHPLGIVIGW